MSTREETLPSQQRHVSTAEIRQQHVSCRGKTLGTAQEIGPYSLKRCRELKAERTLHMYQIETTVNHAVQRQAILQLGIYIGSHGSMLQRSNTKAARCRCSAFFHSLHIEPELSPHT